MYQSPDWNIIVTDRFKKKKIVSIKSGKKFLNKNDLPLGQGRFQNELQYL